MKLTKLQTICKFLYRDITDVDLEFGYDEVTFCGDTRNPDQLELPDGFTFGPMDPSDPEPNEFEIIGSDGKAYGFWNEEQGRWYAWH